MSGTMLAMLFVTVFAATLLVGVAIRPLFGTRVNMRQRLALDPLRAGAPIGPTLLSDSSGSIWARLVATVERRGVSLKDSNGDALAERLMLAGFGEVYAVRAFVLIKTTLTLALPLVALAAMYSTTPPPVTKLYTVIAAAALIGMYLPDFIVRSKAGKRRQEILNGFPDTLDLMLVCVDAGLGIDATFARVGAEITDSHPLLGKLLATVSLELRAGRSRDVALRNLARRTALPELVTFVTLINQSAKLGSSIGQALKIYATEMREARRMRAEEKAARLPVLLSIPLVLFLLPTMVSVLMLPAAITVHANLSILTGGTN